MESAVREELSVFLNRSGGQALGVVLSRKDGLPVTSVAPGVEPKLVSALTALALGSLRRMGEELKVGATKQVVAYFENRLVLVWPVKDLYIVVLATSDANLGLLLLEVERLANRLSNIL